MNLCTHSYTQCPHTSRNWFGESISESGLPGEEILNGPSPHQETRGMFPTSVHARAVDSLIGGDHGDDRRRSSQTPLLR